MVLEKKNENKNSCLLRNPLKTVELQLYQVPFH